MVILYARVNVILRPLRDEFRITRAIALGVTAAPTTTAMPTRRRHVSGDGISDFTSGRFAEGT